MPIVLATSTTQSARAVNALKEKCPLGALSPRSANAARVSSGLSKCDMTGSTWR